MKVYKPYWKHYLLVIIPLIIGIALAVYNLTNTPVRHATGLANLTVKVSGIANNKGKILAAVCDKSHFLKQCEKTALEPAASAVTLMFSELQPGSYAVMVFHDENDNKVFDKTAGGIPLEGYGFSRDAKGHYAPPTFEDAMVEIKSGNNDISIKLLY
ncbi:DUF2141 domain-containing protein [Undibacterium curvum]|uniref:DUF2141 domain-containing protein n=1 Tax=Undibacterium curvum TaxID=2762294 RepID=UPI003D0F2202